jgi:hypothetical protein
MALRTLDSGLRRNDEIGLILPSQQALDVRRYYFRRWPFDPLEEQIGAI